MKTDIEHIQRITWICFKDLHFTNLKNLNYMGNFVNMYHLLKLNEYQTNNLKRPIVPSKIEEDIQTISIKKFQGHLVLAQNSYKFLKKT